MRKEILLRILVLAGIGILLVPVIRLLFVYLDIYPRAYSLEIGQYNNVVTRYVYDKDESATNILEGLADGRRKIGEVAEKDYSLDDYYASMLREYQLADEAESKQGNGNLRLKESQELGQAATSLQSSRLKPILGSRDKDIIGSLQGMKVTHKYDGTRNDLAEPPKKDEETFDNRATRENKSDESPMESVGHRRDVSELRVYPENRFYTSPIPVSSKSNGDDDLSQLKVVMSKTHYYRFEVIKLNLISKRPVNTSDLQIVVTRDNYIFPNIGGDNDSFFKYKDQTIYGSVCLGYNPPAGTYRVLIKSKSNPKWEGVAETFMLLNRRVPPLQKGFSVVNMEYTVPLRNAEVLGPSGKMGNYHELGNWLKFMDQDACWMLVCQTTAWNPEINRENPWAQGGWDNLRILGPSMKSNGIQVGAYLMCYFTPGGGRTLVGYDSGLCYNPSDNTLEESRFISLRSEDRLRDMVEAVKAFQANKNVDFIGFDFIRTGEQDGLENGPQVVDEMNIRTPPQYDLMSQVDKVKWFARKIQVERDQSAILKWRWWRAHRVAEIVNRVLTEAGATKPAWVFTLGWEHGKQHGQDPYMFFDAGIFVDAAMLYEANWLQFKNLIDQWQLYMKPEHNNVIIGNSADTRLLDGRSENPAVEYMYRSKKGYREIYKGAFSKGLFMHDLSRALWSSKRGLTTLEWGIVGGSATSSYRQEIDMIPYSAVIAFNTDRTTGTIEIKNHTDKKIEDIRAQFIPTFAWAQVKDGLPKSFTLLPRETVRFAFRAEVKAEFDERESVLGYVLDHKNYRRYFFHTVRAKRDLSPWMMASYAHPDDKGDTNRNDFSLR